MEKNKSTRNSFVVEILNSQNSTWQGTITWVDTDEVSPFRSAMEMLKLIDTAVAIKDGKSSKDTASADTASSAEEG